MKSNTTPSTRSWAPAPAISTPRRAGLWLACLTSLALIVPAASAAVSLTPTPVEPECVVLSGVWSASLPVDGGVVTDVSLGGFAGFRLFGFGESFEYTIFDVGVSGLVGFGGGRNFSPLSLTFDDVDVFGSGRVGRVTGGFDEINKSWSGTYSISFADCEPTHGVPEGGSALALFACGLGAVGAGRRFMNKRRA